MSDPIALITVIRTDYEANYLSALSSAMPGERILLFRDLTDEQRAHVRIAIVANPDPADFASLPSLIWVQSLWAGVEQLVACLHGDGLPIVRMVDPEMSRTMATAHGGSGGGGSHGAATSGMTYHSEPVSSPWNRPPWPMAQNEEKADTNGRLASTQEPPDAKASH